MTTDIVILEMEDIMKLYGLPWNYAYNLVNEKGCPVLPRKRGKKIRVIQSEFEAWLKSRKN